MPHVIWYCLVVDKSRLKQLPIAPRAYYLLRFIKALFFRRRLSSRGAVFIIWACFSLSNVSSAWSYPRYGLWVETEGDNRPFFSKKDFQTFLDFSGRHGFTDLYCQVYRRGRSWFPSEFADDTPYQEAIRQGFDPLKDTISRAHRRGQKVHAWINLLRVKDNPKAPLLLALGQEAPLMDNFGNSLLAYDAEGRPPGNLSRDFQLDTAGVWLDPSSPAVREYLLNTIREILLSYPDIDGIHLDMVRFPSPMRIGKSTGLKLDFGYAPQTLERFNKYSGGSSALGTLREKLQKGQLAEDWNDWRRSQVTLIVYEAKELINSMAPEKELSAAVFAWPDRAYRNVLQDWQAWLAGRVIDTAMPMSYTEKRDDVWMNSRQAIGQPSTGQVMVGLGAWLMLSDHERLAEQVRLALRAGADGVTLFSYSNLLCPRGEDLLGKLRRVIVDPFQNAVQD